MDGWHCDKTGGTDSGRESSGSAPDGSMVGFSRNSDGRTYQPVDTLTDSKMKYSFTIKSAITWNPNPHGYCTTYFSVMDQGADYSTRTVIDQSSTEIYSGSYAQITHNYIFDTGHSYDGKVLIIEYAFTTDGSSDGWAAFDDLHLTATPETNTVPTDLQLSEVIILQGETFVGTISANDPDADAILTYSLAAGTGDADNALVEILNSNELHLKTAAFYNSKSSYSVRLKATDNNSASVENEYVIIVVNEVITIVNPSFELPAGEEKISNPNEMIGWHCDKTSGTDSGREWNGTAPDGFMAGYARNSDGRIYQAVDTLTANETRYIFTIMSAITWNPNPRGFCTTYISVMDQGADFSTRTVVDQLSTEIYNGGFAKISHNFLFDFGHVYSDKVVIIEYAFTTDGAADGWAAFDDLHLFAASKLNTVPSDIRLSSLTIDEGNSFVGTISATDPDEGATITFDLAMLSSNRDSGLFEIQNDNELHLKTPANYEDQSSYVVRIKATDNHDDSSIQEFVISVNNVNESPANISLSRSTVPENVVVDVVVATLSATDPDAGDTFTYTFTTGDGTNDADNAAFTLVGNNLFINESPDILTKPLYKIVIKVEDAGGLFFEKAFVITVTDPNEQPTDIVLSSSIVNENVSGNTVVGTFSATDPDTDDAFTYSLTIGNGSNDADNTAFTVTGASLLINATPDFESKASYNIFMKVTDVGGLFFEKAFVISVTNVNEQPTDIALSSLLVPVNALPASVVGILSATDPDAGDTFTFSLTAGNGTNDADNAAFTVTGTNLTINSTPDLESRTSYNIYVKVSDGDDLTFEKAFVITVTDPNFQPTNIALSSLSVNENVSAATVVGTLSATDPDAGDTFTYSLALGNGTNDADNAAFTITGTSLSVNASPNFETKSSYNIYIRVADSGGLFFEKAFVIAVINVNEQPTNIVLSSISVNENVSAATVVGTFSAIDPDNNDTHTYYLVVGNGTNNADNAAFTLTGGVLSINMSPNFEVKSSYNIYIKVTDAGGLFFEKAFTIGINDVNEAPVNLALSATNWVEGSAVATLIGTLSANDEDAGEVLSYSLIAGNGTNDADNSKFSISGNKLLSAVTGFDYEATPDATFHILVQAADAGGLTSTLAAIITLTDSLENSAPTGLTLSATSFNENISANSVVAQLSAIDVDASDIHTFELVAGDGLNDIDNAKFSISGRNLIINETPNFEVKNKYSIVVKVSDAESSVLTPLQLTVADMNDAPANLALSNNKVAENKAIGTEVGILSATDEDLATTLTFALVAGDGMNDADNALFAINGNKLVTNEVLDFETQLEYHITVNVTDGTVSITKSFVVTVTDETSAALNNILKVAVYPNPVKDILTIKGIEGEAKGRIYMLTGSLIKEFNLNKGESTIGFSEFNEGLYILEIIGANNNIFRTKITK
jgi:hypothetical protein